MTNMTGSSVSSDSLSRKSFWARTCMRACACACMHVLARACLAIAIELFDLDLVDRALAFREHSPPVRPKTTRLVYYPHDQQSAVPAQP